MITWSELAEIVSILQDLYNVFLIQVSHINRHIWSVAGWNKHSIWGSDWLSWGIFYFGKIERHSDDEWEIIVYVLCNPGRGINHKALAKLQSCKECSTSDVDVCPIFHRKPLDNYSSNHGIEPRDLKNIGMKSSASTEVMNTPPHAKLDNPCQIQEPSLNAR